MYTFPFLSNFTSSFQSCNFLFLSFSLSFYFSLSFLLFLSFSFSLSQFSSPFSTLITVSFLLHDDDTYLHTKERYQAKDGNLVRKKGRKEKDEIKRKTETERERETEVRERGSELERNADRIVNHEFPSPSPLVLELSIAQF